jgi:phosphoglycerate dehydrogenase-like enzyme
MTRLLIYAASLAAVAEGVARFGNDLEVLVVDENGTITMDGRAVAPDDARPEIAWVDHRVFFSPAVRSFFTTLLKSPALTWVQSAAAGFDSPAFRQIVAKGVRLSNSHGQAIGIADYVLWGVLDHFQNGAGWRADQAAKTWRPRRFREVDGSAWLIVGFGAIGQAVATRARAFGASITGVRRDPAPHPLADRIAAMAELPSLLPEADVVVLCTPLNPATRGLADAAFFGAMKAGSVLVNVGRGALVDETALLAALDAGVPAHAVLDVFHTEPLPPESPFWTHPRASLTPHSSGVTDGQDTRNAALFLDNLGRFVAGEPLLNLVSPEDVLAG